MEKDTISDGTSARKREDIIRAPHQRLWWMELARGIITCALGLLFLAARSREQANLEVHSTKRDVACGRGYRAQLYLDTLYILVAGIHYYPGHGRYHSRKVQFIILPRRAEHACRYNLPSRPLPSRHEDIQGRSMDMCFHEEQQGSLPIHCLGCE